MPLDHTQFYEARNNALENNYTIADMVSHELKCTKLPDNYYDMILMNKNKEKLKNKVKKLAVEGYYIERSGYIEIYLKSNILELICCSSRFRNNVRLGRTYSILNYFLDMDNGLKSCFMLNSNTLISHDGHPNLNPITLRGISQGVKCKITGMFTQEEIKDYGNLFNVYVELFLQKYIELRGLKNCL